MITSSFVTLVQQNFPDWSRVKILAILNEVQKMAFNQQATEQMRMYDPITGLDPKVTIASGQIDYYIGTISGYTHNAWRVYELYSSSIDSPLTGIYTVNSPSSSTPAKIVANTNTQAGTYYIRCYRHPTELSTEAITIEVPEAYHVSHLMEGVIGYIEKFRSGKSERWDTFQYKLLPDLIKKLSDGKRRDIEVTYRPCGL